MTTEIKTGRIGELAHQAFVMPPPLTDQDLLARRPVWEALSELWLDTELSDLQLAAIARTIAASPYSLREIRIIHDTEVAPAVSANLMCIAGEWAGFDSQWLDERCRRIVDRHQSWIFRCKIRFLRPLFGHFTADYWERLIPQIEALRRTAT